MRTIDADELKKYFRAKFEYLIPVSGDYVTKMLADFDSYIDEQPTVSVKEVPMKPTFTGDGYADGNIVYDTWTCPNCGTDYEVEYDDYKCCPECGQKIDWS